MPPKHNRNFNCFVLNCSSSTFLLRKWEEKQCSLHNVPFGDDNCPCEAPYFIHHFPPTKKEKLEWIKILNRAQMPQDSLERILLYPNVRQGVCSKHFVEGVDVPCDELGYEFKEHLFDHEMLPPDVENLQKKAYGLSEEKSCRTAKRCLIGQETRSSSPSPEHVTKRARKDDNDNDYDDDEPIRIDSTTGTPTHLASLVVSDEMATPQQTARHGTLYDSSDEVVTSQESAAGGSTDEMSSIPETTPLRARRVPRTIDDLIREMDRLRNKNELLTGKLVRLRERYKNKKPKPSSMLSTDKKVKLYTGMPNKKIYNSIFKTIQPTAGKMKLWNPHLTPVNRKKRLYSVTPQKKIGRCRVLNLMDEYLMTLMRLRLGLTEADLADRFGCSLDYCSRTLITWIKLLAKTLGCLVFVPTREQVQGCLPGSFKNCPLVKHIIDGTEIFVHCSKDLILQWILWSNYKHHHTCKFLISICPNGFVCFISKAYGGRITDKQITRVSNFFDVLEPQDEVLADRGFPIAQELNERFCKLSIPKGCRGVDQFSKDDIAHISKIAKTRIHVERAIKRLKVFRILKSELETSTVPQLSDMLIIIAAICNLLPPIVKDKN